MSVISRMVLRSAISSSSCCSGGIRSGGYGWSVPATNTPSLRATLSRVTGVSGRIITAQDRPVRQLRELAALLEDGLRSGSP
jgi:hypothetical protein